MWNVLRPTQPAESGFSSGLSIFYDGGCRTDEFVSVGLDMLLKLKVEYTMKRLSVSVKIFILLIIILAALAAISVFLPQGASVPSFELPLPKTLFALLTAFTILLLYGGLGLLGMNLARRVGFADLWSAKSTNRQRLLVPAFIGVGIGLFFILVDAVFSRLHGLGPLPHPPFPTSLVASGAAAIGEEVIFRLFFVSFWVWAISSIVRKDQWKDQIFWIVVCLSALAFAFAHIPSLMFLFGWKTIGDIPTPLLIEIILLNGVLSAFVAYFFRKYGFLSAVSIHFWADVVWHVIRGAI
jgi:hypothetical protein